MPPTPLAKHRVELTRALRQFCPFCLGMAENRNLSLKLLPPSSHATGASRFRLIQISKDETGSGGLERGDDEARASAEQLSRGAVLGQPSAARCCARLPLARARGLFPKLPAAPPGSQIALTIDDPPVTLSSQLE